MTVQILRKKLESGLSSTKENRAETPAGHYGHSHAIWQDISEELCPRRSVSQPKRGATLGQEKSTHTSRPGTAKRSSDRGHLVSDHHGRAAHELLAQVLASQRAGLVDLAHERGSVQRGAVLLLPEPLLGLVSGADAQQLAADLGQLGDFRQQVLADVGVVAALLAGGGVDDGRETDGEALDAGQGGSGELLGDVDVRRAVHLEAEVHGEGADVVHQLDLVGAEGEVLEVRVRVGIAPLHVEVLDGQQEGLERLLLELLLILQVDAVVLLLVELTDFLAENLVAGECENQGRGLTVVTEGEIATHGVDQAADLGWEITEGNVLDLLGFGVLGSERNLGAWAFVLDRRAGEGNIVVGEIEGDEWDDWGVEVGMSGDLVCDGLLGQGQLEEILLAENVRLLRVESDLFTSFPNVKKTKVTIVERGELTFPTNATKPRLSVSRRDSSGFLTLNSSTARVVISLRAAKTVAWSTSSAAV